MPNNIQKALVAAVLRVLRPLVRILLRNGVSYPAFADLAKWVYVDVATGEFGIPGRKQSVSRVSVITGLNRKEVSRVQRLPMPDDTAAEERYNRAARVIGGWMRDSDFGSGGKPADLPMEGDTGSFEDLVRRFSGDIPPRAILDELLRVGAVERTGKERVRLLTHGYVPAGAEADKLHILGTDASDLIATIDHNLRSDQGHPWFQRKLAYDNLPEEVLAELQRRTAEQGQRLLEELDGWVSQHDRDVNPEAGGTGRKRAGVGIFYFQGDAPREE